MAADGSSSGDPRDLENSNPHSGIAVHEEDEIHEGAVYGMPTSSGEAPPELLHRFWHDNSILCLTVCGNNIIAGTQGGDLLVFALDTYQKVKQIKAHDGSILGLCLTPDQSLLLSSAGDRYVNLWDTASFKRLATFFSHYDTGDIFCVSFSAPLQTIYIGCQNTSIQWFNLKDHGERGVADPLSHPLLREHRFFDSSGPGGIRTPTQSAGKSIYTQGPINMIEIDKQHIHQFAHYGYVYCMAISKGSNAGFGDDELLITGGGDGKVRLWALDREDKGRIEHVECLEDGREDTDAIISFALDGTLLFSGRVGGEINVWDLETRQLVRALRHGASDVLSLSMCCSALFSAGHDGHLKQYGKTYDCTHSWEGHRGRILATICCSFQGKAYLITGANDNSIAIWDVQKEPSVLLNDAQKEQDELIKELGQFVSFRTVSGEPRYKPDCRRGASYLRSLFSRFGATTQLLKTPDGLNPIVYARFRRNAVNSADRGRLLFYGHYDVIAAENKQGKWMSDPFNLSGIDGYLYGRGASDNKGPIMAAMFAAADMVAQRRLASDIVFLIEGEEENGSKGFRETIRNHKELIGPIDFILLANSYWLNDEVPCLTYGLRGVVQATIQIQSDQPDLHSGVDGSKLLDEPLKDLVMLVSKLAGPKGHVRIPGFNDDILPPTKAEVLLYDDVTRHLLKQNPHLGPAKSLRESLMRRWRDGTLTVHRFKTSGSEKATIIPHHAEVSLSMRLVPNQSAEKIGKSLVKYLETEFEELQSSNTLTVKINHQAEPWLGDPSNKLFSTLERAVVDVWSSSRRRDSSDALTLSPTLNPSHAHRRSSHSHGTLTSPATSSTLAASSVSPISSNFITPLSQIPTLKDLSEHARPKSADSDHVIGSASNAADSWKPLYIREGGSIPAIRFLEKEFDAPAAHLPCGQASDNAHLDNERLRALNLLNAREVFKRVFIDLLSK